MPVSALTVAAPPSRSMMIRTPSAGHSVYRPAGGSAAAGTSIREGRQTQQRDNREQASQATGRLTSASGWQVTELITAVCVLAVTGLRCACSQGPEGEGQRRQPLMGETRLRAPGSEPRRGWRSQPRRSVGQCQGQFQDLHELGCC